jgi:hypothetical protein
VVVEVQESGYSLWGSVEKTGNIRGRSFDSTCIARD